MTDIKHNVNIGDLKAAEKKLTKELDVLRDRRNLLVSVLRDALEKEGLKDYDSFYTDRLAEIRQIDKEAAPKEVRQRDLALACWDYYKAVRKNWLNSRKVGDSVKIIKKTERTYPTRVYLTIEAIGKDKEGNRYMRGSTPDGENKVKIYDWQIYNYEGYSEPCFETLSKAKEAKDD